MTRVKRSIHARKKRRATLALAKGYRGDASRHYRRGQGGRAQGRPVPLPRPPQPQARFPAAVDHPDQRRRAPARACRTRSSCTASSWRASSSTARCSRTSPSATPTPSDALPTAPARRWRPADEQPNHQHRQRAPLPKGRAPFLSLKPMTITSPHNQKLKEIRKLRGRRRWREQSGRFVAEGEDLLEAADAAGWQPVERYCAAGSGLPGIEVEPELLAQASGLGSGTRALAVYEERWAPAPLGPLVRLPARRPRPRQRRRGAALRRRRSAPRRSRSAPTPPTRSVPRPCGPAWARCSASRWRGRSMSPRCPGTKVALASGRGDPLAALHPEPQTSRC